MRCTAPEIPVVQCSMVSHYKSNRVYTERKHNCLVFNDTLRYSDLDMNDPVNKALVELFNNMANLLEVLSTEVRSLRKRVAELEENQNGTKC